MTTLDFTQFTDADVIDPRGDIVGRVHSFLTGLGTGAGFVRIQRDFGVDRLVPLAGASENDGDLQVAFFKTVINGAPDFDVAQPTDEVETEILNYYEVLPEPAVAGAPTDVDPAVVAAEPVYAEPAYAEAVPAAGVPVAAAGAPAVVPEDTYDPNVVSTVDPNPITADDAIPPVNARGEETVDYVETPVSETVVASNPVADDIAAASPVNGAEEEVVDYVAAPDTQTVVDDTYAEGHVSPAEQVALQDGSLEAAPPELHEGEQAIDYAAYDDEKLLGEEFDQVVDGDATLRSETSAPQAVAPEAPVVDPREPDQR